MGSRGGRHLGFQKSLDRIFSFSILPLLAVRGRGRDFVTPPSRSGVLALWSGPVWHLWSRLLFVEWWGSHSSPVKFGLQGCISLGVCGVAKVAVWSL